MNNEFYKSFKEKTEKARKILNRPMTLAEKILYVHLYSSSDLKVFEKGEDYVNFRPDRVAMQDATAQMALLQFMNSGRDKTAVPATIHCDHLIQAYEGAEKDLKTAEVTNKEVYDFLKSVSARYGIGFWKPGSGIIHQIVLENYGFPGGMMIGTDSHTPNAGGLCMIAVGVGGSDAADVMTGMEWELKMPKIIGVKLTGSLTGWASAKDVILKLVGILTVKGGTNSVIEYFGEGTSTISATGKATICNMGAEVGATASVFPFDKKISEYLEATGRGDIARHAASYADCLRADDDVEKNPENFYDRIITINLSEMEPYVNGPFTPDAANPISMLGAEVKAKKYPEKVEVALIGSCTNSSYEDLSRAANLAKQAIDKNIKIKAQLIIDPGSSQILDTAERDGMVSTLKQLGATIMANSCGPCIGQWKRVTDDPKRANSIVTSFNRNFAKRADGNPNTHAFIASPEITIALAIGGSLLFNPLKDGVEDSEGKIVKLRPPSGDTLPARGFVNKNNGYTPPPADGKDILVEIDPASQRLQFLELFNKWDGEDMQNMPLLIKVKGKCTTDHISMAGEWLRFRGHLENISDNMLMGAVNFFNDKPNLVLNAVTGEYMQVSAAAKDYKSRGISSVVIAEENYGEGSSREHAAMEPRFLNVKAILVKSFARIHETNLKKQGVLAITFKDKSDYDKIRETDKISINGLKEFASGKPLSVNILHADGTVDSFSACHSYNAIQIEWFKAGSALNALQNKKGYN